MVEMSETGPDWVHSAALFSGELVANKGLDKGIAFLKPPHKVLAKKLLRTSLVIL
jgi:hypothetical protein